MSNISSAFENKKALIAHITCGDPDLATTGGAIRAMAENGADLIQLGIPFSDPTAEGPVLQQASIRALKSGVTTDKIFDFVRQLRKDLRIPMVFMTYANVVFSYGADRFFAACRELDIHGLILPDLPFEEKEEFLPFGRKYSVDLISMIAPASQERICKIARQAQGFAYITDGKKAMDDRGVIRTKLATLVETARQSTSVPCIISDPNPSPWEVQKINQLADGILVESAIVELLSTYGSAAPAHIGAYIQTLKQAMNLV